MAILLPYVVILFSLAFGLRRRLILGVKTCDTHHKENKEVNIIDLTLTIATKQRKTSGFYTEVNPRRPRRFGCKIAYVIAVCVPFSDLESDGSQQKKK